MRPKPTLTATFACSAGAVLSLAFPSSSGEGQSTPAVLGGGVHHLPLGTDSCNSPVLCVVGVVPPPAITQLSNLRVAAARALARFQRTEAEVYVSFSPKVICFLRVPSVLPLREHPGLPMGVQERILTTILSSVLVSLYFCLLTLDPRLSA